jgi:hypothetical protein
LPEAHSRALDVTKTAARCCSRDRTVDFLNLLQWPAMLVTLMVAWLLASSSERRRNVEFWVFLRSNLLWIVWGWHVQALAAIALQVCLAALNSRGAMKIGPEGR